MTDDARPGPALRVTGLTVRYGGVTAVDRVSLEVAGHEVVGLIGPNGAGKTSLVDAITGFTPYSGELRVGDHRLDGLAPHRRAERGLARTWQSVELFSDLDVRENVAVATRPVTWRSIAADLVRPGRRREEPRVVAALDAVGLADLAQLPVAELSLGRQKLVGLARALAQDPSVLVLDEPAAGLDTDESRGLGRLVRSLADGGLAVLLIDHDLDLVMDVCDRVTVLDFGAVIAAGTPSEVRNDPDVVRAYVGTVPA